MASRIKVAIYWNTMLIQYFNQNEIWNIFWKELSRLKFRVVQLTNVFDNYILGIVFTSKGILEVRTKVFFILRRYINRENWTILCPRGWCKLEQPCRLRAKDMRYITGKTWYKHVRRISYHVRNILIWYTK